VIGCLYTDRLYIIFYVDVSVMNFDESWIIPVMSTFHYTANGHCRQWQKEEISGAFTVTTGWWFRND
jgi:hypothetical protein